MGAAPVLAADAAVLAAPALAPTAFFVAAAATPLRIVPITVVFFVTEVAVVREAAAEVFLSLLEPLTFLLGLRAAAVAVFEPVAVAVGRPRPLTPPAVAVLAIVEAAELFVEEVVTLRVADGGGGAAVRVVAAFARAAEAAVAIAGLPLVARAVAGVLLGLSGDAGRDGRVLVGDAGRWWERTRVFDDVGDKTCPAWGFGGTSLIGEARSRFFRFSIFTLSFSLFPPDISELSLFVAGRAAGGGAWGRVCISLARFCECIFAVVTTAAVGCAMGFWEGLSFLGIGGGLSSLLQAALFLASARVMSSAMVSFL